MTTTAPRSTYHHGDLRAALLRAANELLEEGAPFSLRAIARRAGVSPTAPYRHFADRGAVESALAVQGMHDLMTDLAEVGDVPRTPADLAEMGVAYVRFALRRPGLYRLMFDNECDDTNDARVQASSTLHDHLGAAMKGVLPQADSQVLATAAWSMAHGLASLHLDGKLSRTSPQEVDALVRSAFLAVLEPLASASGGAGAIGTVPAGEGARDAEGGRHTG